MADKKKTLLILSPGFAKNEADTNCLPAQQALVLAINQHYPDLAVRILSFQYPFENRTYTWFNNPVFAFGGRNRGFFFRFFNWIKIWLALRKTVGQTNTIGLLSFWLGECALLGHYFSLNYGIPHYTWLLGQDAKKGNRYMRLMQPRADALIAISDFLQKTFYENYGILPKHVIPNGITRTDFENPSNERGIDILGAGSLIPLKQYDVFITTVYELKKSMPTIRAVLCGDGPEKKRLNRLIAELNLEKNISVMGELPHTEVLKLMQQSKIFLHPSSYEGFSSACLEALYAGTQVVSFTYPMKAWIKHWYQVADKETMLIQIREILSSAPIQYRPVTPYLMQDSSKQIVQLFTEHLV
jgi:glycosyltransferase involved in cell wall biosynthesis